MEEIMMSCSTHVNLDGVRLADAEFGSWIRQVYTGEATVVLNSELAKLRETIRLQAAFITFADCNVDNIFTFERCARLGYRFGPTRSLALGFCWNNDVEVVRKLVKLSAEEVGGYWYGKNVRALIFAVVKDIGLTMGMQVP